MELNQLLLWMVYVSCTSLLLISFKYRKAPKGWLFIATSLLGITVFLQKVLPSHVGLISGIIWLLIVLIPQRGSVRIHKLILLQKFHSARRWAQILRLLHPMDSFWQWPRYIHVMELLQSGQLTKAEAKLFSFAKAKSQMSFVARCQISLFRGDWQAMLNFITQEIPKANVISSSSMMTTYLIALGETNSLNEMILDLERFQPQIANSGSRHYWDFSRLIVFAYCGQQELVTRLLKGPLADLDESARRFWSSTAAMATGEKEIAHKEFNQLISSDNGLYANTLTKRVPQTSVDDLLNDHSRYQLKAWGNALFSELQDRERQQSSSLRSPITLGLIALNLAFFMAEIILGSSANELSFGTNAWALYTLGALIPQDVVAGDWWRLLAAAFLHSGPLHLSQSIFGLALLGPFVEKILGTWRFLASYLITAMGSMLTVTLLTVTNVYSTPALVGASGAIIGLMGTEAAIQIRILRQKPSKVAATRLRLISLFVIIFIPATDNYVAPALALLIGSGVGYLSKLKYMTTSIL